MKLIPDDQIPLLNKLVDRSHIEVFDHDKAFGVVIAFAEKGFGFGEITLSVDKETGQPKCDLEAMSTQHCGQIIMRSVGTEVKDAEKEWHAFMALAREQRSIEDKDER